MDASLKIIERMLESVYNELKIVTEDPHLNDKAYRLLKEAVVDAINLKRQVETARALSLSE